MPIKTRFLVKRRQARIMIVVSNNELFQCGQVTPRIWVSIGSGNGFMPDGAKSLPEQISTYTAKVFCGIRMRKNSQEGLMKSIRNICTEITVLKLLPHPPRDQWVKQLSKLNYAVITLSKTIDIPKSNITRYWIQHKRKKAKTLFRLWTPERHLIARPKVRAMGRLS